MRKSTKKTTDTVLWARQYSKRLITALLVGWALGAVVGAVYEFLRLIASPETAGMDAFYIYLAVPLTCGLPSYLIPNLLLNKEKVKQKYIPNYDQIVLNGEYGEEEGIGPTTTNTEETDGFRFHADYETLSGEPGHNDLSDS